MLDLVQVFPGRPTSDLNYLFLPKETLLIYPSVDVLVILNIQRLTFLRSLVFWEVFPALYESGGTISCVCVDAGHNLIIASVGPRIGVWCLSEVKEHVWRVHSSVVLDEQNDITCLDCRSGLLAVGTMYELGIFTLSMINDIPSWSKKWTLRISGCSSVKFSPSLAHLAVSSVHDFYVRILSTAAGMQTQVIRHSRPVKKIAWRCSQKSNRTDFILYSVTSDATLRIFIPVLDAPQHLLLHASLDLFSISEIDSSYDSTYAVKSASVSDIFWLDGDVLSKSYLCALSQMQSSAEPDTSLKSIKQLKDEDLEYFVRVSRDGSLVVTALSDIDRKPPTLIRQFKLSETTLGAFSELPSHFQVLSTFQTDTLTLITSPPIISYGLDSLFFFGGHERDLCLLARSSHINTTKYQVKLRRFVRSPEGSGVGIIRVSNSETWSISTGAADREQMQQMGNWPTVDHMVILDGGKRTALYSSHNQMLAMHPSSPFLSVKLPAINSLFCLPSSNFHTSIFSLTPDFTIIHIILRTTQDCSELYVHSQSALPLAEPPHMIIPVDPMAWSDRPHRVERVHDVLLSIACDGELAFWIPGSVDSEPWICTAKVRTARTSISMAKCSSSKKSALINVSAVGEELTIWDSKESEFASGLEYQHVFDRSEVINDLDWTSTPDEQSILAVGFSHYVLILCQQRMSYFNEEPAWGLCRRIDMSDFTSHPISDSIWLTGGSLLVGAGHQMFRFNSVRSSSKESERRAGLFEHVARLNGPLQDYHPQMILQCLLWGKLELVEKIITRLYQNFIRMDHDASYTYDQWGQEPIESFISQLTNSTKMQDNILDSSESNSNSIKEVFSRRLVKVLLEKLMESTVLPHLSRNEVAHLVVLIQTTLEIEEQSRSLDNNGLRYLISMRSFYILNNGNISREPGGNGDIDKQAGVRDRLRFRDMVWAFHSESQEILLSASIAACGGKMLWQDAKALGVFLWLRSFESIKIQFEMIARNLYTERDRRDPLACCLHYFALGKIKLVHGLWKQAAGHKEQAIMLKFLSNDFSQSRWQTAALKNAYALLSKQRFELAAAFFLLGGSLRDAVNVCIKNLDDFQLAIALARIVEHDDSGPVFRAIILDTVLPMAFRKGNRWLGSWSFWLLHRRDLAVKILVTPLENIVNTLNMTISNIGDPHYDDPSLALLFSQIKARTLQTAKGTSEIDGRTEFNFVLQIARVFCRMGCHVLALDLVKTWSFDRTKISKAAAFSNSFLSDPRHLGSSRRIVRRSSIAIDMDPTSGNAINPMPSISQTYEDTYPKFRANENLESLMKYARKDINIPEFDINTFM